MTEQGFATTLVPADKIKPPLFQSRTESLNENLEELVESIKTHGILEPLIIRIDKEQQPELISGTRRLKAAQLAKLTMIPVVVKDLSDEEVLQIQGSENLNRNDLTDNEKTRLVSEWAKLGYDAKTTSEKIHKSYSFVVKYLPSKFKDQTKAEAGQVGGLESGASRREAKQQAETSLNTSDTRHPINDLVSCDNCKMATHISRMKTLGEQDLCPLCFERLSKLPKVPVTVYDSEKPKETWEQRKAQMSPQHSKIEEALRVKFSEAGLECETDRVFCLQSTTPDFYFRSKNLAVYVDGEVHNGKQDRDESLRELLTKRHGIRTLSIPYTAFTKEETNRVFKVISEEVKA